jgi:uncharacterized membrane protein YtjA (UPF0391 family)
MLKWTVLSLILALVFGWLAFKVMLGAIAVLLKLIFLLVVVFFLVSLVMTLREWLGGRPAH